MMTYTEFVWKELKKDPNFNTFRPGYIQACIESQYNDKYPYRELYGKYVQKERDKKLTDLLR